MISIIIPVLNEAELFESQISKLKTRISEENYIHEILVVDGGSTDDTKGIAKNTKGIKSDVSDRKYKGIGIQNVKKRLELLYSDKHKLEITEDEKMFSVFFKIQLH